MTLPASRPCELVIETVSASGRARRLVLRPGQVRQVGRGAGADLSIPDDPLLSAAHFQVSCDAAGGAVRDLRSSNGLFVNGERTSEVRLADGDQVTAGKTVFSVKLNASGTAPAVATTSTSTFRSPRATAKHERPYTAAIADADAQVRREALRAAARTRQRWLLDHLRAAAREPTPAKREELLLLAALAVASDVPRMLELGMDAKLGALRFEILGALGHPGGIPEILAGLDAEGPALATAAARAFTKLTGESLETGERFAATGEDAELAPDLAKPSSARAAAHWRRTERDMRKSARVCQGLGIDPSVPPAERDRLDMESLADLDTMYSFDVKFEGKEACRLGDPLFRNEKSRMR